MAKLLQGPDVIHTLPNSHLTLSQLLSFAPIKINKLRISNIGKQRITPLSLEHVVQIKHQQMSPAVSQNNSCQRRHSQHLALVGAKSGNKLYRHY
jgi:hypothetical protein